MLWKYFPGFKSYLTISPPQMKAGIAQTPIWKVNTCYILTMTDSFKTLLKKYPMSSVFIWSKNNDLFLFLSLVCPY